MHRGQGEVLAKGLLRFNRTLNQYIKFAEAGIDIVQATVQGLASTAAEHQLSGGIHEYDLPGVIQHHHCGGKVIQQEARLQFRLGVGLGGSAGGGFCTGLTGLAIEVCWTANVRTSLRIMTVPV